MENDLNLAQLEHWFKAAEDATIPARTEAERARDYVNGKQLTEAEISELKRRRQPPVVINRIRRKVEWLLGLEVKQRTDPKAFPRTAQHQQGAEAITDAIRYVCDDQDWDEKRSESYDNFLVEGFGGVEVVHKNRANGQTDVVINQYPWDRLFYDPHSRRPDFSDARYKGVVLWMDNADFLVEHKDAKEQLDALNELGSSESASDTFDDRPGATWVDPKRQRVRVILIWYRKDAEWHWCKFIKGEKLGGGRSPYVNEHGESVCPLILESAYVDRDNARYGIVRDMFDPQDEVNKRRSKALHTINSRQTMGVKGAVESVQGLKRELAKPDGHIEITTEALEEAARVGMRPFEVINNNDQTSAQFSLLQEAKSEIDMLGANSALEGETGESTSGRAVLARQQGGMIEIANLNDKHHRFTRQVYRHIWMRIKQFWTEERWIRVTDDEQNARFAGFNRPVTLMEQLGRMDEAQATMIARQMGLRPGDPRLAQPVGIDNNIAELDVDIVLEEVPDRVTLEGEAFEAMLRYAQAGTIPPAVLIEADPNLPVKKKKKLLEMLQRVQPTPAEQLDLAGQEADVVKTQAEARKIQSETAMPLAGIA